MASLTSLEGEADFPCPQAGKPCKTWYKIVGSLTANPSIRPLVLVNGGPGMSHHLLDNLTALNRLYSIPLIFYDQLGSGSSTHLPERLHDTSFWVVQLFVDELHNLVSHLGLTEYDILGSSWGGMLAAQFAASQPKGLQRLAIANSAADLQLRYDAANEYRRELPQEVQDVLQRHEDAGTTDSKEYNEAYGVLFKKHICKVSPLPNYLLECIEEAKKDNTVVLTMIGPNGKFKSEGTLKNWSMVGEGHKIEARTLLINGWRDIASDKAVAPFFREIPKIKWVKFMNSTHSPQFEEEERFMKVVGEFLTDD